MQLFYKNKLKKTFWHYIIHCIINTKTSSKFDPIFAPTKMKIYNRSPYKTCFFALQFCQVFMPKITTFDFNSCFIVEFRKKNRLAFCQTVLFLVISTMQIIVDCFGVFVITFNITNSKFCKCRTCYCYSCF